MRKTNFLFGMIAIAVIATFLSACGTKKTQTVTLSDIVLTAEPPLFAGSNTLQATYKLSLATLLQNPAITGEKLELVRLKSATLRLLDSASQKNCDAAVLQLAATDAEMTNAAVSTGLSTCAVAGSDKKVPCFQMKAAAEGDFTDLFRQQEIIFVADANLLQDTELPFSLTGEFTFEITTEE
jgi:hypothetical protein